jgi:hypothetical protein
MSDGECDGKNDSTRASSRNNQLASKVAHSHSLFFAVNPLSLQARILS